MPRRLWTPQEDAIVKARFPDMSTRQLAEQLGRSYGSVAARADMFNLRKSAAFLASPASGRMSSGTRLGADCRFQPGQAAWNKGLHFAPGGRSAETQFKPGNKPHTWQPIGTVVVDGDGYHKRKVRDDAPKGMARLNWVFVHREIWEQHNGPIPPSHAVAFVNGDRSDLRIENLELVARGALMGRNTVHNLPAPLPELIQLKGALVRRLNKKDRQHG